MTRTRERIGSLLLAAMLAGPVAVGGAEPAPTLTFDQALAAAFRRSPRVRALAADLDAARGRRLAAGTVPFNPELELAAGRRRGPAERATDREIALSEELEIGSRRGARRAAAEAELAAAEARFDHRRRLLAAGVRRAFAAAVEARELLAVERSAVELAREFARISAARLAAGAASQVEANLARAALGRAERDAQAAWAVYRESQAILAETVGLDAPAVEPAGDPPPPVDPPPLDDLLAAAARDREDLVAFRHDAEAAGRRIRLARAEAVPNLHLGAFYAEEEGTDRILGAAVAIALPLFNRNQGGIATARADQERAAAEAAAAELAVRREVVAAHARLIAARETARRFEDEVLGSLEDNLALVERSFAAGKIGAADLLLFQREFVDSRRDHLRAVAELQVASLELELAVGRPLEEPAEVEADEVGEDGATGQEVER